MDPISIALEIVYSLTFRIVVMRGQAKANKAQCELLIERIAMIETALQHLGPVGEKNAAFEQGLVLLKDTLEKAFALIESFTKKTWALRVLKNESHQAAFEEIRGALSSSLTDLQLGLNLHQLLNQEKDRAANESDRQALLANQAMILSQCDHIVEQLTEQHEQLSALQRGQAQGHQQVDVMARQIEQLMWAMAAFRRQERVSPSLPVSPLLPPSPGAAERGSGSAYEPIAWYELRLDELLVEGATGAVYRGTYQEEGVAIKLVDERHSPQQRQQLIRELTLASQLKHRRLTQLYGGFVDEDRVALVMEYMERRDLAQVLTTESLRLSVKQQIALDALHGLRYLHRQGIHYPQLSVHHILLDEQYRAKLSDFWASTASMATLQSIVHREGLAWLAPEELEDMTQTSPAGDVYRFGLLLWALLTGRLPFEGLSYAQMVQRLQAAPESPETLPTDLPEGYAELIQLCWRPDSSERPGVNALITQLGELATEAEPLRERHYQHAKQYARVGDYPNALACYQGAATYGESKAWRYVGVFYLRGLVSPDGQPDYGNAYQAFLQGAQEEDPHAMNELAVMLEGGEGIAQNEQRALLWYQRAGKLGHADSAQAAEALSARLQEREQTSALTR